MTQADLAKARLLHQAFKHGTWQDVYIRSEPPEDHASIAELTSGYISRGQAVEAYSHSVLAHGEVIILSHAARALHAQLKHERLMCDGCTYYYQPREDGFYTQQGHTRHGYGNPCAWWEVLTRHANSIFLMDKGQIYLSRKLSRKERQVLQKMIE